ncbi:MAG TPA: HyaD/HybD family hydrogenase maturation endopeptidase [Methylomusa anaerophila]|uniref:Hydrogenase 2 maturation protease n=1 Tax=Methylomusa anaerophila TaxID=1930071 RepID=A0A348ANV0_9FIRM|nr:HyaD/HybD family hydrogenase maturation endopeptidase [Methylomusa anaerophila]BBB92748.1 hydrogenase 2 maturation protease [Methylomusa anaerophila]HML87400.1 HyaD/HybD family hydrogenase maturation endopeptidase [Methylomusa anaerophila]
MEQITVLGIGNILMQDEGFGVRVVEELVKRFRFPENVQVLDGGTLGMGLLNFLAGTTRLVVLDAINGNNPPGTFYDISNEQVKAYFTHKVSLHELGIQDVLATLEVLEKPITEVVVLGVQPAVVDVGLELTATVVPGIEQAVNKTLAYLANWQVKVEANE